MRLKSWRWHRERMVIGILCGLGGGFFGRLLLRLRARIRQWSPVQQGVYALFAGLFVAAYALCQEHVSWNQSDSLLPRPILLAFYISI